MNKSAQPERGWESAVLRDFPPQRRYLIGVSGGRDSVALLHWLQTQGYRKLVVCHLDHALRGRASRADERFVERLAQRDDLPFASARVEVAARATEKKQSIETAARSARLEFFAQVARRRRCSTIFLGHHADDLVETFLFNLLRGSGQRATRPVSAQTINGVELTIVRPLLGVWREEIDAYVSAHRLRFREDATNQRLIATRNRLRHRVLPMIEKEFGRAVRQNLWRAAEIAAAEDVALEAMLPKDFASARNLPLALQRRATRRWLQEHAVSDIGFQLIENVRALLDPGHRTAKVNLPGNRHARRRAGQFFVEDLPHTKSTKERKGKKPL
ncbi:MAG: tRNA lysidine(34) synthetase TilS [Chthoniobacterales bacterium]